MEDDMLNLMRATVFDSAVDRSPLAIDCVGMSWLRRWNYDVADDYSGDNGQMSEWYGAPFLRRSRAMPDWARD